MNARSIADIRLPASSTGRSRDAFLKLLARVDPAAENGFGFEGCLLRPGALVTLAALHPTPDYPDVPVLLEHSTMIAHGIPGHRRSESLYILWMWDAEFRRWHELGRAASSAWEWAVELRPLAIRALAEARGEKPVENTRDIAAIADGFLELLDAHFVTLKPPDRVRLLGILHDQLALRLCA